MHNPFVAERGSQRSVEPEQLFCKPTESCAKLKHLITHDKRLSGSLIESPSAIHPSPGSKDNFSSDNWVNSPASEALGKHPFNGKAVYTLPKHKACQLFYKAPLIIMVSNSFKSGNGFPNWNTCLAIPEMLQWVIHSLRCPTLSQSLCWFYGVRII